jgi:hypothetical protein
MDRWLGPYPLYDDACPKASDGLSLLLFSFTKSIKDYYLAGPKTYATSNSSSSSSFTPAYHEYQSMA